MRNTLLPLAAALLLAGSVAAQQTQYLDVLVVKVKPERRADFDALNKRLAEANRNNQGDTWLALNTEYGESNTVTFVSARANYAAIDQGSEAFMKAVHKAFGEESGKVLQDFNSMIESSHGELRRRRPDLSMNYPADPAEWAKFVGQSRWVRIATVRVRPGRSLDFEAELTRIKAAYEKGPHKFPLAVFQGMEGTPGGVYYIAGYGRDLGTYDSVPSLKEILGDESYQRYLRVSSELITEVHSELLRFVPELSNAPKDVVAGAPDVWTPKTSEVAATQ